VRKLGLVLLAMGLVAGGSLELSACGGDGKEGGTLTGSYASFPDYLDPALSYTAEGWTAMYDTYTPLLTYRHAGGEAGSDVIPGLAKSLPKISNGGKTYTLLLRKGLKYSDGSPIKASDFPFAVERMFKLNSPGTPFYSTIVGAEEFLETKRGPIPGIEANDQTGEIRIELTRPRGTFNNELAMMFVAPLPQDTPIKNTTADPAPASGPYEIVESDPGRGWSYARNPQWAKVDGKLMPEIPDGHVDKIEISVIRNDATQVNELEQGKTDWMQAAPPPDLYQQVKDKYEGTQFRVEPTVSTYYFWMNMEKPPFDDIRVREAVNYAVNTEALERIYTGQLAATHQILPPEMPGYRELHLYPYDMAKAKALIEKANPSDRDITVWGDNEPENGEAAQYYQDVLTKLGFNAKLKEINADNYTAIIGSASTPDLDTGWYDWFEDYPHPNDFFQPLLSGESILPTNNTNFSQTDIPKLNARIARLSEETLGPRQEREYAEVDKEFMEEAPWVPYGTRTESTFVSDAIDLDKVIWNPTFENDLTSFQFK
jgi:peptide/nickel transport system substrate-binding protein